MKHSGKRRRFVFTTGGPPACRALGSPSYGPGAGAHGWGQLASKSWLKSFILQPWVSVTGSAGHAEGGSWGGSPLGRRDSVLPSTPISTLSELVQSPSLGSLQPCEAPSEGEAAAFLDKQPPCHPPRAAFRPPAPTNKIPRMANLSCAQSQQPARRDAETHNSQPRLFSIPLTIFKI